jgi:hypothetical protein
LGTASHARFPLLGKDWKNHIKYQDQSLYTSTTNPQSSMFALPYKGNACKESMTYKFQGSCYKRMP